MKRLLLTLLGVVALCGLSPHPATAQETTSGNVLHMDFNKRADGHNDDLYLYGRIQRLYGNTSSLGSAASNCMFYNPTVRTEWPEQAAGLTPTENSSKTPLTYTYKTTAGLSTYPSYNNAENYDGAKIIENDQIKIEFNYWFAAAGHIASGSTDSNSNTSRHFASQIRVNAEEGGLYLYPGTTLRISTKGGKKIKKITIKTPYLSSTFTTAKRSKTLFVYKPQDVEDFSTIKTLDPGKTSNALTTATISDATFEYSNPTTGATTTRASVEIKLPENLPGENDDFIIGVPAKNQYPYNYNASQNKYNFAAITNKNIYQLREPFGISAIDIEYYGDDELPKYVRTITCGKDNGDEIKVEKDGTYVSVSTLSETTLSDDLVKLRIGDAIVEIARTASSKNGKPTVTFDNTLKRVGVHAYSTIKAYLDPDKYMYNGSAALPYEMTYIVNGSMKGNEKHPAAYQSARSMTSNTAPTSSLNKNGYKCTQIATMDNMTYSHDILSLQKYEGIPTTATLDVKPSTTTQNYWGAPFYTMTEFQTTVTTQGSYNAMQGTDPAFAFDGISFLIPSDTPNPPAVPIATTDIGDGTIADGIVHTTKSFKLTLKEQSDDYDNHRIEYITSPSALNEQQIDWTNATRYSDPINIDKSLYVYARTVSAFEGADYGSNVTTIKVNLLENIAIADLADLHKAENDGKVVMLSMPLIVRGNCKMNVQGADAAKKFTNVVYARDVNGVAVKLISRRNNSAEVAFPSSLSYKTPTKDRITLLPINTIVGKYRYNDGVNPEIVIRDLTSGNPADDYYSYQGTESSVEMTLNGNDYQGLNFISAKKLATDEEYTDMNGMFGKIVILRGLTNWNAAENSFELSESDDKKTVKIRCGTTVEGSLSAGSPSNSGWDATTTGLSSDKTYSVIAAVEYDPEANNGAGEYYLAPTKICENFAIPQLQIPEEDKDKFVIKKDDNGNITEIEYTEEVTTGTISLTLEITRPTGVNSSNLIIKDEDGKTIADQDYNSQTSKKIDIATSKLTFDEETGTAVLYASAYYRPVTGNNYNIQNSGDKLKIVIRDAVQTGPEVVSIKEFRKKIQEGTLSTDQACYVRFNGRFAVVARNGNVLQLRDVDKDLPLNPANAGDTVTAFKDSYILVHDNDNWQYKYTESSWTGFPVTYAAYGGNELWNYYGRGIKVGDEIRKFIGKVTIDNAGNLDVDLTGLGNFFASSALFTHHTDSPFAGEVSVPGYVQGTPRFIPYMALRDSDGNPVTDKDGNPVMGENNCVNRSVTVALSTLEEHPDNHPEKITLTDDLLDAEMNVMKVQVAKADASDDYTAQFTADGVTLLWDMFGTDQAPSEPETEAVMALADEADGTTAGDDTAEPTKSLKEQLADHLAAGTEHFNVIGILRKHTDGKYAIQVEKLEPTPADRPARFFADGVEIKGESYEFIKRMDLTTDTPDGAVIKMTVGDGTQEAYDPEKLKGIDADTKVTIKRSTPGVLEGSPTTITLTKLSTDAGSLAEVAGGDNAKNLYHFRKHLKVVAAAEGTVMTADKEGNLAVVAAAPAEAEAGKYLADIVLVRNSKNTASLHEIDADAELLDEDESYAIATPAPATLFGVTVAEGNATDAEGNIYTIDPTFAAIPEGDAEAWKLTGYVLADDNDKPVIYLTASQAIDRVALPVITPAEAAFLDKTTVSITCDTEGAAIEYSLDGGKTWNPYTGAFDATASGEILARATADDMLPSHEAKASVVREYLSGDVTITVDEQEALTVITINGPAGAAIYYSLDGAAEKLYNGPLTLTNDTQAVINGQIKAYALESGKRPGAESVRDYQIKFKPEVTGISGVGADQEAGSVRVEGNSIIVPEGAQTFDIAGRRVNPQGLPRGIYIVRLASGKAVKAVVK